MSKFLHTAQNVKISGLKSNSPIHCAVSLGKKLYVSNQHAVTLAKRIYVYDIEDGDLRHENYLSRKITFSNRRSMVLNSVEGHVKLIVPCSYTKTLYILVQGEQQNGCVHRVGEDGVEISRWSLNHPAVRVRSISINPIGTLVAFVTYNQVDVYSSVSTHVQYTYQLSGENIYHSEIFAAAVFKNDNING